MAKHQQLCCNSQDDNHVISIHGYIINIFCIILIGISISVLPLLVNTPSMIISGYSMPIFIGIIIVMGIAMYCNLLSALLVSIISGIIYFITTKSATISFETFIISNIANILQIVLMFGGIKLVEKGKKIIKQSSQLTPYNTILLTLFLSYCYLTFTQTSKHHYYMFIIAIGLFVISILYSIGNVHRLKYIFGIALIPSGISSLFFSYCGASLGVIPKTLWIKNLFLWWLSNYILLQTVGYLLFLLLYQKDCKFCAKKMIRVHIDSLLYYVAILVFNIFIIHIYTGNILDGCEYVIFFPYFLGNFLLGSNFYFSRQKDCLTDIDHFQWYEGRVITIEKNMSIIMTVITFLIPMGLSRAMSIPPSILPILILNILFACVTVGLVWIPERHVKFMALTKTIKTISFSYAIVLSLINLTQIFKLLLQNKPL